MNLVITTPATMLTMPKTIPHVTFTPVHASAPPPPTTPPSPGRYTFAPRFSQKHLRQPQFGALSRKNPAFGMARPYRSHEKRYKLKCQQLPKEFYGNPAV